MALKVADQCHRQNDAQGAMEICREVYEDIVQKKLRGEAPGVLTREERSNDARLGLKVGGQYEKLGDRRRALQIYLTLYRGLSPEESERRGEANQARIEGVAGKRSKRP